MRRALASLLAWSLVASAYAQVPPSAEQEAADGIRQVQDGDFETAVTTLDSAVRRLDGQPGRERLLVQALVQLGVALVALDQAEPARARFRRALVIDPRLRLSTDTFSPKVVAVFEQARREAEAAGQAGRTDGGAAVPAKPLIFAGLGAAAAAVALAVRGGDDPPTPPVVTLSNARFSPPAIVCPDNSANLEIPFIVLVDVTVGMQRFVIDHATVEMTVVSSPALPSEVGFVSNRGVRYEPRDVAPGTVATVHIDSSLLCTNGAGGTPRFNEWQARITLGGSGTTDVTVLTQPPSLRVDLP